MQIRHRIMTMVMTLSLFMALGGPLALLQGVAWVTMVHDFSKSGSLSQAVEKTFDGQHPCPLCQKLSKARAAEEKAPVTVKIDKKAEVFIATSGFDLCCDAGAFFCSARSCADTLRSL